MDWNVRFRFNKSTGEVELFEVDHGSADPEGVHNREHDRLAAEVGNLLERGPRVVELFPSPIGEAVPKRLPAEELSDTELSDTEGSTLEGHAPLREKA